MGTVLVVLCCLNWLGFVPGSHCPVEHEKHQRFFSNDRIGSAHVGSSEVLWSCEHSALEDVSPLSSLKRTTLQKPSSWTKIKVNVSVLWEMHWL